MPQDSPSLSEVLIPELIIYCTGGNILAFCPTAFVHKLADAIEKRYTERTLIANSCAVGETFKILEIRFADGKDFKKEWTDALLNYLTTKISPPSTTQAL